MSEKQPYISLDDLYEVVPTPTIEGLKKADRDITAEHKKMCVAVGWLSTYGMFPDADPDEKKYYQSQTRHLAQKLDSEPRQTYYIIRRYEDLVNDQGEFHGQA